MPWLAEDLVIYDRYSSLITIQLTAILMMLYNIPRSHWGNLYNIGYVDNDYILLKVQTTILESKNECLSPGSPSFCILGVSKFDQTTRAITP